MSPDTGHLVDITPLQQEHCLIAVICGEGQIESSLMREDFLGERNEERREIASWRFLRTLCIQIVFILRTAMSINLGGFSFCFIFGEFRASSYSPGKGVYSFRRPASWPVTWRWWHLPFRVFVKTDEIKWVMPHVGISWGIVSIVEETESKQENNSYHKRYKPTWSSVL